MMKKKLNSQSNPRKNYVRFIEPVFFVLFGSGTLIYSLIGASQTGFFLSLRRDPDQLHGGLFPLFLLIGITTLGYGLIELWLRAK
jgi:hypothetical protein